MNTTLSKVRTKENILLAVIWGTVTITGFLALGATIGGIEGLAAFGRIHSLAVRFGLVYTVVQLFRNREQIMARFGVRINKNNQNALMRIVSQSPKIKRVIAITNAIVFHIVLHIVSVHLAAVYTIYHIIQHRHEISSLFKKLPFKNNVRKNHAIQIAQAA